MRQKLLSSKVESMLNELIGEELKAMYFYMATANWCQDAGYLKAFGFFREESADEKAHAEVLQLYILDMGCVPDLMDIDEPEADFTTLTDVINAAYEIEVELGKKYAKFAQELAATDGLTFTKIQEFTKIQTESIGFYGDICAVSEGLSSSKFEQLKLEEILVNTAK